MQLRDILPLEKWVELEKDIQKRSGMSASVFDTKGIRITDYHEWSNKFCPAVKANKKGQSFICAVAHMNLSAQAKQTKKAVIEECDAGLLKLVVPIFVDDEFLGAVGGCGLLLDEGEVDTFLVNKLTEIDEAELESLSKGIGSISAEKVESICQYLEERVARIVSDYKAK